MKKSQKPKVLIILGPTASGKTALAISLAKHIGGEIISADSRQVYRGLDIATGKVTKKEMSGVPHHLLDVASPSRVFTAQQFMTKGRKAIADIIKRGKVPIIAGGTGFYIDALVGGVSLPQVPPNMTLRKTLEKMSASELYALLTKKDPRRAKDIDAHNPVRLVRALEIAEAIGKSPKAKSDAVYDVLWIGISVPFADLEKNIEKRLTLRMKQGMIAEAERLREEGLPFQRMEALGLEYRYLAQHLQEKLTKAELLDSIRKGNIDYAKRQMKYWKRNKDINWLNAQDQRVETMVEGWVK